MKTSPAIRWPMPTHLSRLRWVLLGTTPCLVKEVCRLLCALLLLFAAQTRANIRQNFLLNAGFPEMRAHSFSPRSCLITAAGREGVATRRGLNQRLAYECWDNLRWCTMAVARRCLERPRGYYSQVRPVLSRRYDWCFVLLIIVLVSYSYIFFFSCTLLCPQYSLASVAAKSLSNIRNYWIRNFESIKINYGTTLRNLIRLITFPQASLLNNLCARKSKRTVLINRCCAAVVYLVKTIILHGQK